MHDQAKRSKDSPQPSAIPNTQLSLSVAILVFQRLLVPAALQKASHASTCCITGHASWTSGGKDHMLAYLARFEVVLSFKPRKKSES